MGFRIRKSISLGKGLRLNLGKSGITSVSFGRRGAPHVTMGKNGTRFGTPVLPGTGISYETRLDKPSKKMRRKKTTMDRQQKSAFTSINSSEPEFQPAAVSTQQMEILTPTEVMQPSSGSSIPPRDGGNNSGGRRGSHRAKKPWYKRWWAILIIALIALFVLAYIVTPSNEIPDVTGRTVAEAKTSLNAAGFDHIKVTPDAKGGDKKWRVESQNPQSGKQKTSLTIDLAVKRDTSDLAEIAKENMRLDTVIAKLTNVGYTNADYQIESDTGKSVLKPSNWVVVSAKDGVIQVHNKAADEEAAKKAEEEKKRAEEEAARKAEEEKKAAEEEAVRKAEEEKAVEEQARRQAEQEAQQQAAAEEAARQAQIQAEQQAAQQQQAQQQLQQSQQSSPQSVGTVHGGSFCSSEGSTGTSSAGNLLTCRVASDGRLRWMK